jgi:protein TonB
VVLLLLLLQLAGATSNNPAAHVLGLFSYHDYPPEAVNHHWQGMVRAELTVGIDGRPSACHVIQSSGYKVLDDKTCKVLMSRAKFPLAHDLQGNPVVQTIRTPPIKWGMSE